MEILAFFSTSVYDALQESKWSPDRWSLQLSYHPTSCALWLGNEIIYLSSHTDITENSTLTVKSMLWEVVTLTPE
jgi:hypothetical protein